MSRDPGQLGLFAEAPPNADPLSQAPRIPTAETPPATCRVAEVSAPTRAALPRDPDAYLERLRDHGMRGVDRVIFTRNRRTMVSLMGRVLRVHEGFAVAPPEVQVAIATFATSRNRAKRSSAREIIVTYPVPIRPAVKRPATSHPDDAAMVARLTLLHAQLNLEHFEGALDALEIQVSRRTLRRLGHYTPRSHNGGVGEIVISRRHIRRDGWPETIHTLLHEMVHQWQDETGRPVDHGAGFRAKCRAVGIEPAATRVVVR
jgi:SprT-like family